MVTHMIPAHMPIDPLRVAISCPGGCGCSHIGGCLSCGCRCRSTDGLSCPCCGKSDKRR